MSGPKFAPDACISDSMNRAANLATRTVVDGVDEEGDPTDGMALAEYAEAGDLSLGLRLLYMARCLPTLTGDVLIALADGSALALVNDDGDTVRIEEVTP